MSTNTIEGEILTIKEIAEYLKVTERTLDSQPPNRCLLSRSAEAGGFRAKISTAGLSNSQYRG